MANIDPFEVEGLELFARLISSDTFNVENADFQAWLESERAWEADERKREEDNKRADLGRAGVKLAFNEQPKRPLLPPVFKVFHL